ncbi:hypothetical protein EVAR_4892_1 [Eumeta japonica]|uniref:Uncharacterized protein n=1 Tax=Eumeta variegata TaxID=151549 RepID=A0A4C1T1Y9_EUMVA|nr:hypothetical protein EVAR_4892_1 [Eumeta japonica]
MRAQIDVLVDMLNQTLHKINRFGAVTDAPRGGLVGARHVSEFVKRLTGYNNEQYMAWLRESEKGIPMSPPRWLSAEVLTTVVTNTMTTSAAEDPTYSWKHKAIGFNLT